MEQILEYIYVNRELQSVLFKPVCDKYDINLTEILVLLYLDKKNSSDTARDIVHCLRIAKSHISSSIHNLEKRGYIVGYNDEQDHRAIHLKLCESAHSIIGDIHKVKEEYISVVMKDFTYEEKILFFKYIQKITNNANEFLDNKLTKKEVK